MDNNRGRDNSNPFRGRGQRGRSRGRRYAGNGRSQTFEDNVQQQQQQEQQVQQPQNKVVVIKKEKKIDPKEQITKTDLGNYYRDWIEGDRKNVLVTMNMSFEDNYIKEYQFKVEELVDLHFQGAREASDYGAYFKAGLKIAVSLRLFRTIAQTQSTDDYRMKHFYNELERYEIPASFNLILENIGKFSDEHLGNIRIIGINMIAKKKIIEATKLLYDTGIDEFIHMPNKREEFNDLMRDMESNGSFIWKDRDSIKYMKERALNLYSDLNIYNFDTQSGLMRLPYFDFTNKSASYLNKFIKGIEKWTGKFESSDLPFEWLRNKSMNEVMACLAVTNFLNVNVMSLDTNKLSDYITALKGTWFSEATWGEYKSFINLKEVDNILSKDNIIENGFICAKIYEERCVPILRREIKLVEMTNSQFGNISQLIEQDDKHSTLTPAYKSISPFKDKNPVVLGAVFNFAKSVRFKRNLQGFLTTTKSNIIKSLIINDLKNK